MNNINKLTPEELRIRCAEKCGWREAQVFGDYSLGLHKIDSFPFEEFNEIPDYEHDRNALQELILAVPEDKYIHFIKAMIENLNLDVVIFNSTLEIISPHKTVPGEILKLLTTDPLAIMRAFLRVMEAE